MYQSERRIIIEPVTHQYWVDGKHFPSVTQLLPKQDYFISDERLAECADEGTANHAAVEDMIRTGVSSCGYTDAVQKFMSDIKGEIGGIVLCETPLASAKGFAGTPDMIFENGIVDLKRTFGDRKIHGLQTAGYGILAVENGIIKETKKHYILVAHEDGTYKTWNVYNPQAKSVFESLIAKYKIEQHINYYLKSI